MTHPNSAPKSLQPPLFVRVPASTSNLGPGFDCLGLAAEMWLEVALRPTPASSEHTFERVGSHAMELLGAETELVVEAFALAARSFGVRGSFRFRVRHEIPIARGFGSSGAAVAAGLLLAAALREDARSALDRSHLLRLGIALEGHPDNVTASLFGGATLCHPAPDGPGSDPVWVPVEVHSKLRLALAWPHEALSTARARAALPRHVPLEEATENPRRLALLLAGLRQADPNLLRVGGEDALHVRHRLPLIPGAAQALEAARAAGAWLATISGAGSGLVALGPRDRIEPVARAMEQALRRATGAGCGRVVPRALEPPVVESLRNDHERGWST